MEGQEILLFSLDHLEIAFVIVSWRRDYATTPADWLISL